MIASEYLSYRIERLNSLTLPEGKHPLGIRIHWFDVLTAEALRAPMHNKGAHMHPCHELHLVFEGRMSYECEGEQLSLGACDALWLPPNCLHHFLECSQELLRVSIAFSLGNEANAPLFPKHPLRFLVPEVVAPHIETILALTERDDVFVPHIISGRVLEILLAVFDGLDIALPAREASATDVRVLIAQKFIENYKSVPLSCADVAKECALSEKQLNRLFKTSLGVSVYEYIVTERVKYAKVLLAKEAYSIKEIGFLLGFQSESNFVSFFKRHAGFSPGSFRRLHSERYDFSLPKDEA